MLAAGIGGLLVLRPRVPPVIRVLAVNGRITGVPSVDVRPLVNGTPDEGMADRGNTATRDQTLIRLAAGPPQAFIRHAAEGLDAAPVAQDDAGATHDRTR